MSFRNFLNHGAKINFQNKKEKDQVSGALGDGFAEGMLQAAIKQAKQLGAQSGESLIQSLAAYAKDGVPKPPQPEPRLKRHFQHVRRKLFNLGGLLVGTVLKDEMERRGFSFNHDNEEKNK